jgi:predicted nucleotidyltransferase
MVAANSQLIEQVTRKLVEGFQPLRIVLFGSYARGTAGPDSDLDLLVVMPDGTDSAETAVAMRQMLCDLPTPKDIIVTTPQEISRRGHMVGTILRPAIREGIALYERS